MKINHGKCSYKRHGSENNEKLKLERLDRSVGANVQTTIHIINCLRMKKRWKSLKKDLKVEMFEKSQPIIFKYIICKISLDCSEKSLDQSTKHKI